MSKYTTQVRFICEMYAGLQESVGANSVNSVIANSREKIFNFSYPIYDENYRSVLETKILKHYYTKEIGFETAGLWQHWLDMRMNEIMPYYNQLYESCLIKFNPMYDVDLTTSSKRTTDYDETTSGKYGKTNGSTRTDNLQDATEHNVNISSDNSGRTDSSHNSSTSGKTASSGRSDSTGTEAHTDTSATLVKDRYSDTPQGALSGVESDQYLTNARITDTSVNSSGNSNDTETTTNSSEGSSSGSESGSGNTTTSGSAHSTENGNSVTKHTGTQDLSGNESGDNSGTKNFDNVDDYLEHVVGKRGGVTFQQLLKEYRETFLNIDMMIIEELDDLFMKLW